MAVNTPQVTEEEARMRLLLQRIAGGDEAAFAEFYRHHERRVYYFILSKLNHTFEAADILNVVFMEVWQHAAKFEGRSKVSSWLFGIAYHKVIDCIRKNKPHLLNDSQVETLADERESPLQCLLAQEHSAQVRSCIDRLNPLQRATVELALYEELAYAEIAAIVNAPVNTVKTRMFHARQSLMQCLKGLFAGGVA